MTITADVLQVLPDEGLLAVFRAAGDEADRVAAVTEAARRDQADRLARARERLAGIRAEGELAAHAQYLEASEWTRGRLLSREGMAAAIDETDLWRMPWDRAARFASEELRDFFQFVSPRITAADYVRERAAESRAMTAAGAGPAVSDEHSDDEGVRDERGNDGPGLADDEPGALRCGAAAAEAPEAGAGGTVRGGGRSGAGDAQAAAAGSGARRPAGSVQPAGGVSTMLPAFTTFADIPALPSEPLWPGFWPRGEVVGWFGPGGLGKGRSELDLAARITRGDPMPFCTGRTRPGSVILVLPEDHPSEQVRPRLDAAGADVSRVVDLTRGATGARFKLSAAATKDGDVGQLRECIETLRSTCAECRAPMAAGRCPACGGTDDMNPRLVIVDPLSAVIGYGSISTVAGARKAIEPLQDIAASTGVVILLTMHTTKAGELQGSAGVRQCLRLLYRIGKDTNPLVRVISLDKANNQGETPDAKFTLESTGGGVRCVWLDRAELDRRTQSWRTSPPLAIAPPPPAAPGMPELPEGAWHSAVMGIRRLGQAEAEVCVLATYPGADGGQLALRRCQAHPLFPASPRWYQGGSGSLLTTHTGDDGTVTTFGVTATA